MARCDNHQEGSWEKPFDSRCSLRADRAQIKWPVTSKSWWVSPPGRIDYLVGEKLLNFLEAAETDTNFRAEIPAFVEKIKTIFERWQLAQYLETARATEPCDPSLFEPRSSPLLGDEEIEFDAEEVEDIRKNDIRQCTRDLLMVERAREWLLED